MKKKMKIQAYGLTDQGPIRPNNEDVWLSLPKLRFFALADGMGGHQAGEIASKETIDFLKNQIYSQKTFSVPNKELISFFDQTIQSANRYVYNLSKQSTKLQGMGTTLCLLYIHEKGAIYAHIGDSRIYRYRRDELKQLTQDHSLPSSKYTKHIITRAIGTGEQVLPEIAFATIEPGDLFFMCSDGLSDFVSTEEIESLLKKSISLKKISRTLIQKAKEKGSHDNITVLLIRVQNENKKSNLLG